MLRVESLAGKAEWAGLLAGWHFAEWRSLYPGWAFEAAQDELARHSDPDRIPLTLVAAEGNEPVGSVSLVGNDLAGWDHFTPWLASLYVRADRRGRGIGRLLVGRAVAEARRLGVAELYLFTPGQQAFYGALGWHFVAQATAAGDIVTVMSLMT